MSITEEQLRFIAGPYHFVNFRPNDANMWVLPGHTKEDKEFRRPANFQVVHTNWLKEFAKKRKLKFEIKSVMVVRKEINYPEDRGSPLC